MTQDRMEQEQQGSVAARVTSKLRDFAESLPDDERAVLAIGLRRVEAANEGANDTAGFSGNSSSGALDAINSIDWQKIYNALSIDPKAFEGQQVYYPP